MAFSKNSSKRDGHSKMPTLTKRHLKQPVLIPQGTRKEKKKKNEAQFSRRKEMTKIRAAKMKETKRKIGNINETKSWFFKKMILAKIYLDS